MNSPKKQSHDIMKDLAAPPKEDSVQDECEHEMWLVYIPDSKATCRKCGFSRDITKEEWDNF